MKRSITLFILVFLSLVGYGQQTITGQVEDDQTGETLPGAHLYLVNNWRVGTTTLPDGTFSLTLSEEDLTDTLVVSFIGFQERLIPVSQMSSKIGLSPVHKKLEEVTVSATPLIAEEFQYQKVNKIEVYTNPSAKADPILAVNSMPSATTADESANISLRGASPIETGIFFNDVPIYDAVRFSQLNGIGTFSIFNTSIVKSLSVFAGNPPLEYGNVTSGLVSISTDDNVLEANQNTVNLSLANVGYSRAQKISDRSSLMVFANYQPSELIKGMNQEALEAIKDFDMTDLGLYYYLQSENGLSWKVFNYSIHESYDFRFRSPSYTGIFSQVKNRNFTVSKLQKISEKTSISLNNGISISKTKFNYSASHNEIDKMDWFVGFNYQYFQDKYQLKLGFASDNRTQRAIGSYPATFYAFDVEHEFISFDSKDKIRTNEAFAYAKYYLNEDVILGAGARKNLFDNNSYLSGQSNLLVLLGKNVKWITGVGVYHKDALTENANGKTFIESKQISTDLEIEAFGAEMTISAFAKKNSYNTETIEFQGLEFFATKRFSDKLGGDLSYTFLQLPSNVKRSDIPNINYFMRGNFFWKFGKSWTLNSNVLYRQGNTFERVENATLDTSVNEYMPIFSENNSRLPDYFSLGLSMSRIFFFSEYFNMIAFASVNNLTDHENVRSFVYNRDYTATSREYFSKRTIYFGVVINF